MKKTLAKNTLFIVGGFSIFIIGLVIIWVSNLKIPDFRSFAERKVANSTKIYDNTGKILLYDLHKNMRRTVVAGSDIGINVKNAVVAIEDAEFYDHNGIRPKSIIRALWQRFLGNPNAGGGSTITQQLIKNTLLTQERTISRKLKEWILALKIERSLNKEEILTLYLNEAPYGNTVYGVQEGSMMFFNKKPSELTLAEAAYIAAIPNRPTYYSPYGKNKDKLDQRKNLVLSRMHELGFITEQDYQKAKNEVVVFQPQKPANIIAPHFIFFLKDELAKRYGEDFLESGGLNIVSTIDFELQKKAEEIAKKHALENEKNADGENAAIVVIDTNTGGILAMVGSRDYFDKEIDGNFNVATAMRQPGSSFKPFVYALAFNKGYTDETVLFDVKTEFSSSCNEYGQPKGGSKKDNCYSPDNYDNAFRGPMSLRDALAQSINTVAVKLLYLVGYKDAIRFSHELGITSLNDPDRYGLSLVIGGGETSLLDMTSAYSVFATEGIRHPYKSFIAITDNTGKNIETTTDESINVLPAQSARLVSSILSDNKARTPTFGINSSLHIPGASVAVKTGTTNSNRDAWTIGYSPNVAVGVWVGNNDNRPMKKGGVALAGPIWNETMIEALRKYPETQFTAPNKADPSTPPILRGFWRGGETFVIDSVSRKLATANTPESSRQEISITNVHSILYWIDKDNPLGGKPSNPYSDPLYNNFEYGVQKWWAQNAYKYPYVSRESIPSSYDDVHTERNKPKISIPDLEEDTVFDKNTKQMLNINVSSINKIQKIDVFINENYITSIKQSPFVFNFTPIEISNISHTNNLKIIAHDIYGNISEENFILLVNF